LVLASGRLWFGWAIIINEIGWGAVRQRCQKAKPGGKGYLVGLAELARCVGPRRVSPSGFAKNFSGWVVGSWRR
jgi:hypothetical protein